MKTVRIMSAVLMLFLFGGWGGTGHRIINGEATRHLPPEMAAFVAGRTWLADSASVPDWRRSGSRGYVAVPSEGPRHYLDVDDYPEYVTRSVPTSLAALIAQVGVTRVEENGVLPWAIGETLDSLTVSMRRRDLRRVWALAADLGHYVADGHNPLHCTVDYNGRSSLPGSSGIHSRYESSMVDRQSASLTVTTDTVHYVDDPVTYAFGFIYDAQSLVDTLYSADLAARTSSGWSGSGSVPSAYLDFMWQRTGALTKQQFQKGTVALADLFYTAWVDAGRPDLSSVASVNEPVRPREAFRVLPPYPNPFNASAKLWFELDRPSTIRLDLVAMDGRVVAIIAEGPRSAGQYQADVDASALSLSSGLYLVRLTGDGGGRPSVRKLLLLR